MVGLLCTLCVGWTQHWVRGAGCEQCPTGLALQASSSMAQSRLTPEPAYSAHPEPVDPLCYGQGPRSACVSSGPWGQSGNLEFRSYSSMRWIHLMGHMFDIPGVMDGTRKLELLPVPIADSVIVLGTSVNHHFFQFPLL